MRVRRSFVALAATAALAAAAAGAAPAGAAQASHAVFVQTDNPAGNQIVAYDRAPDGTLTQAGVYGTGGLGGTLEGSVVDHLASQGSLTYDRADDLLFAVNAGSGTVSVFAAFGDRLALRQVIPSGGSFPVSVAVQNGLVYVLNATAGGSLQGFRVLGGQLVALPGSSRALGLNPEATPQFVNTPGQVAFSADGAHVIVTTKANGNAVDVFGVKPSGRLTAAPEVTTLPGAVPFALESDPQGDLLLTEAGPNAVAIMRLQSDGELTQLDIAETGQKATCWIVRAGDHYYVSNAGSGSLSGYQLAAGGQLLVPLGNTPTDGGTVDAAATPGGRFLYVQTGAGGIVDEFAVTPSSGALTEIGTVTVPAAVGGEGVVAP